jgi:predicted ATPase/DNA-binding SARP family transcriptional activator
MTVDFQILGPLQVVDGAQRVDLGRPQQRALLARLLIVANEVVPTERLIDDLWEGDAPAGASGAIQSHVSRLRKALGPAGPDVLVHRANGYALVIDGDAIDARRFEALVRSARAALGDGDANAATTQLRDALGLWRGRALADVADAPFAQAEIVRLEEARVVAVEDLFDARLAVGDHEALVGELDMAVSAHPLRERRWGQRMLALYRCGRQAEALRAYADLRSTLGEQLGIDPSPAVQRLESAILRQDPALDFGALVARVADDAPHEPVRELPAGTVTLLAIALDAAARLAQQLDAEYGAHLVAFRDVVRKPVEVAGGVLASDNADSLVFGFASAAAAVDAALTAQLAAGEAFASRMALSTGELTVVPGVGYVGVAVHQVARLAAIAHRRQVLVAASTREVFGDGRGLLTLRDLGTHRLEDLDDAVGVLQLCHPELPAAFPALRSAESATNNLPADLTSFIGREALLEELGAFLATTRLVTLFGPGGTGKTRLALRAAEATVAQHRDGVWFVDLVSVSAGGSVVDAFASALGVREQPGVPLSESVIDRMRTREALLLVDNCEHVLGPCVELVGRLLRSCRGLQVLATSRERLGVPGETSVAVPPLTEDEAVRLFRERSVGAEAPVEIVVSICERVDRLPLAIELAAAQTRILTVADIDARLATTYKPLRIGDIGVAERQRTLGALIGWSHDLLDEEQRTLFRRLAVFVGGFDAVAAEAVCAGGDLDRDDVLHRLTDLLDRSLLVGDLTAGVPRFRMLETVRDHARGRLRDAGEDDDLHARLHEWCQTITGQPPAPAERVAHLDRIGVEHANLVAALEWSVGAVRDPTAGLALAVALVEFWDVRGHWSESQHWLDAALDAAVDAPAQLRADALTAAGWRALECGEPQRAWERFEEAVVLERADGDEARVAGTLSNQAIAAWSQGLYDVARARIADAIEIHERLGNRIGMARALGNLGNIEQADGDLDRAQRLYEECLVLARELGDERVVTRSLTAIGWIAHLKGDDTRALARYDEALLIARDLDDQQAIVVLLYCLGEVARAEQQWADAGRLFGEALALGDRLGAMRDVVESLEGLAKLAADLRAFDDAATLVGVVEGMRATIAYHRAPSEEPDFQRAVAAMRVALDDDAFDACRAAGAALTEENAMALARAVARRASSDDPVDVG